MKFLPENPPVRCLTLAIRDEAHFERVILRIDTLTSQIINKPDSPRKSKLIEQVEALQQMADHYFQNTRKLPTC